VTTALADALGSAMLVALTVTRAGDGTEPGAEYAPAELMIPTVPLPPAIPLTFQLTVETDAF
jgi:hypothetical protein